MTWLKEDGRWMRLLGWSAVLVLPGGTLLVPLLVATRRTARS